MAESLNCKLRVANAPPALPFDDDHSHGSRNDGIDGGPSPSDCESPGRFEGVESTVRLTGSPGAFSALSSQPRIVGLSANASGAISRKAKEQRKLAAVSLLALGLVALFAVIAFLLPPPVRGQLASGWCESSDCRHHAFLLTHGLNRSIDPCTDFEAYVCSTWEPDNRLPFIYSTAFDDLSIAWMDGLEELLERGSTQIPVARKPLALFRACVGGNEVSEQERAQFMEFLKQLKLSWPKRPTSDVSARSVLVRLAVQWDMSLWLRIRSVQHPFTTGGSRIVLLPGRSSDIRLFAANHEHVMAGGSYTRYWSLMYFFLLRLHPGPEFEVIIKRSAEAQGDSVATLLQVARYKPQSAVLLFRASEIDEHVSGHEFGPWLEALRQHLDQQQLFEDDILVANSWLMRVFNRFVTIYGDADAVAHLSWQVVQMYAPLFDKMLLEDIFGDKMRAEHHLTMLCAREVEAVYSPLITSLYVRHRLTSEGRVQASFVLQTLRQKAVHIVSEVGWLDSHDRQLFSQELEAITVRLWPPDLFDRAIGAEDLYSSCPENDASFIAFWINARKCVRVIRMGRHRHEAESFLPSWTPRLISYESSDNVIDVAVAALSSPLFYAQGTLGMVYGGLGYLLAVALMGVFRDPPQYVHPNGSVSNTELWISDQSMEALKEKQRCSGSTQSPRASRGIEIGALEVAYSAFHDRVVKSFQSNLTSELTNEKVFFMTLCRNVCFKKHSGRMSWPMVACNELVANLREFSDVFGCSEQPSFIAKNKCAFF